MSVLPVGIGSSGVDVGDIGHSLRLRSAASASLTRTITTDATSTYFAAIKRGKLGVVTPIFDANIKFNANDTLTAFGLTTTAVFRDPTSWLFIHVSNGGLYVNGVSYGAVTTSSITNPRIGYDGTNYADMYVARIGVVGGTSSSYTNFGYQNTEINEWVTKTAAQVKAVVDAGGTNSFMLDFDNGTSLTTLGYDKSVKGNNWTLNNVSLTAGSTYDHMLDVPGNSYAVLNPLNSSSTITASAGNLTCLKPSESAWRSILSTISVSSGKYYAEFTVDAFAGAENFIIFGIAKPSYDNTTYIGALGESSGYQWVVGAGGDNCSLLGEGAIAGSCTGAGDLAAGNVISVCYDATLGRLWAARNGTWMNSGNPAAGTGYTHNGIATTGRVLGLSLYTTGYTVSANFGQRPFTYTPPTGFKALCQANLPDPAILNPELHFDVVTRTANGSSNYTKTGLGFRPDLIWTKERSPNAYDHVLWDSVRGVTKWLASNSTAGEATASQLAAFTSDGYTINYGMGQANYSTATYVDWLWKMGGAAVTNNNGSISSQVSANVLAGQSVVTYTGTGANATVGHGLASAPELIIHKNRNVAYDWPVWHKALLGTEYLMLNTTAAKATDTTFWNSSTPTTTTFPLGTDAKANYNQQVALCFHSVPGYSKIGSYTGNGSVDGPYVECGHRPKLVLIKCSSTTGNWVMIDTERQGYNVEGPVLLPNSSGAESAQTYIDVTSNGFKLRSTGADVNAAQTYIFISFASTAAKYSLGF